MFTRRSSLLLVLPATVLLVLGFLLPSLVMLLAPPDAGPLMVFERLVRLMSDSYDLAILVRTIRVGAVTTALALLLGYPIALLLARSRSRWAGPLLAVAIFPLLLSSVVRTYGWLVILGSNGVIGQFVAFFGFTPPQLLYTEVAIVLGLLQLFLPLAVVGCYSSIAQVDPGLEEAARGLGASPTLALWTVTVPLSLPGVVVAATLVFAGCTTAYTTPYLLGGSKHRLLSTQLFHYSAVNINWASASAVALVMTVLVFAMSAVSALAARRGSVH